MLKTPAIASPTSAISSSPEPTGTSVSSPTNDYAVTFRSFVDFFKGPAIVQHSFQSSATSSSASKSSPSTNDYADMFQPFVDFFEGPVTIQRSSSTITTSIVRSNDVVPLSSVSSDGSKDDHMAETCNTNATLILCLITVITLVLFICPVLRANRRVRHLITSLNVPSLTVV
ncbi:hypothetical protein C8R42DRAFT_723324 [Lentinula raphanica]|nr:hypothetical protein C8R42DRAFT_723324 [Lentinula raphanica]